MQSRRALLAIATLPLFVLPSCDANAPTHGVSQGQDQNGAPSDTSNIQPTGFLDWLGGSRSSENVTRYAAKSASALTAPANTIVPTTPNGTKYVNGESFTDALAPDADVKVGADGSASVHVPLWVPPGRNGIQPELSIDYNSRAKPGISGATLGTGWQLSGFPMIHRCARTAADSPTGISVADRLRPN